MAFDYKKECKNSTFRQTIRKAEERLNQFCQGRREFLTSADLAPLLCMCLYSEIDPDGRLETGMPLTSTLSLS